MSDIPMKVLSSAVYGFNITDETGVAIGSTSLTSLKISLYDIDTRTTINGRLSQDALNANGVAVGSTGNVTWTITPADNAIVTTFDPRYPERHRAVFDFEWASGAKRWWNSVDLVVTREPAIVSTST